MRITNSTMVRNYTKNLNSGLSMLNKYNNQITTTRQFTKMYENTTNGVRAMQIRRSMDKIETYTDTAKSTNSKFTSAHDQMIKVVDLGKEISALYNSGLNGTNSADERNIIAENIERLQEQILSSANGKFSDRYIFGGTNTTDAPFTTQEVQALDASGNPIVDAKGINVMVKELYYNGVRVKDIEKTTGTYDELFDDAIYSDIGLGMKNDANGKLVESSAFKSSLTGIDFLGYGDKSMYDICSDMIAALRNPNFQNVDEFSDLLNNVQDATSAVTLQITNLGADMNYLDFSIKRMEDEILNLSSRQNDVEFVDPSSAIMDWKMQEYVYNAALQMGQRLLQPTLFSFIN